MVDRDCERFGQAGSAAKARNGPTKTESEGKVDQVKGKVQNTVGGMKDARFATTNNGVWAPERGRVTRASPLVSEGWSNASAGEARAIARGTDAPIPRSLR